METQDFSYGNNDDKTFKGYLAFDETKTKPSPLVLVIHDWTGINEHARERARWLAKLGYVGFAIDMYGNGENGNSNEEKMNLIAPFMENRQSVVEKIAIAINAIKEHPHVDETKVAIIGFCFGGLCALDAARAGIKINAAVSFHGLLNTPNFTTVKPIAAKILALHGNDDPMVPFADVQNFSQEMTEGCADWQLLIYGNTQHAFTNKLANDPELGTVYNAKTDQRSWIVCKQFLSEVLNS